MTAAWPAWLAIPTLVDGYSEESEVNLAEFKPEVGAPKRRRRTSIANDLTTGSQNYDEDETDDIQYFFRVTLADGVLPFTMIHARTQQLATWQFIGPPKISAVLATLFRVQFSLRLLDMTQLYRLVDYDYATLVDSDGAKLVTA